MYRPTNRRLADAAALPAIDRQQYAGDEFRFVRREEYGGAGNVPGFTHVTQRYAGVSLIDEFLLVDVEPLRLAFDGHWGVDEAGHDCVDANAERGVFHCE